MAAKPKAKSTEKKKTVIKKKVINFKGKRADNGKPYSKKVNVEYVSSSDNKGRVGQITKGKGDLNAALRVMGKKVSGKQALAKGIKAGKLTYRAQGSATPATGGGGC